jgi:hypothetical protein
MTASTWCFHVFYAPLNLLGVPVETGSKTTFSPRGFAKRAFGPHGGNVATLVAVEFRQHRTSLIGIRAFFGAKTAGAQIQMSAILIRCRRTSRVVPTGLTTENVKFISLAGSQFSMVCPVCGGIHRWKQRDAWVEGSDQTKRRQNQRRIGEVKQRTDERPCRDDQ